MGKLVLRGLAVVGVVKELVEYLKDLQKVKFYQYKS